MVNAKARKRSPQVLIDLTSLPKHVRGAGRYMEALVAALMDSDYTDFLVICQKNRVSDLSSVVTRERIISAPGFVSSVPLRLVWEQTGLPWLARRLGVRLIHSPHYTFPILSKAKKAVTVHDATFFSHTEKHLWHKRLFFRLWSRISWRKADLVFTPSQATLDALTEILGQRKMPSVVAHHGVDQEVFHPATGDEVKTFRDTWGLENDPFIAFLGTIEPRKNVPELLEAFAQLVPKNSSGQPLRLVLAGEMGWDENVQTLLVSSAPENLVIVTGYLELESLRALLSGAEVVVYPSEAEGFGLPVLEAMACGSCVLSSPLSAIPEIGGRAIEYCEPRSTSIASALGELLRREGHRLELKEKALERSRLFSWEMSAQKHIDGYELILNTARNRQLDPSR